MVEPIGMGQRAVVHKGDHQCLSSQAVTTIIRLFLVCMRNHCSNVVNIEEEKGRWRFTEGNLRPSGRLDPLEKWGEGRTQSVSGSSI